jgi:hypothetical protein
LPDGVPATSVRLQEVLSIAADKAGNVYFPESPWNAVFRVDAATGQLTRVAGNGKSGYSGDNGPATDAQLSGPHGVAVDASGALYIAEMWNHTVRKVSKGIITTIAGNGTPGYSGDNGPATSARLNGPESVAVDASGTVYIADTGNNAIRKVSNGVITTIAGTGKYDEFARSGPAIQADLARPHGVAVDPSGDWYVIASGAALLTVTKAAITGAFRRFPYDGPVIPGHEYPRPYILPSAPALDASGNVYIADGYGHRIYKISDGVATAIAGNGTQGYSGDHGPATGAQLRQPLGVAVDGSGNVYIADSLNRVIRKLSNGTIATIAGRATGGLDGSGPALNAQLNFPLGVAADASGNVYIADQNSQAIRKVSKGTIGVVAGTGEDGFSGDGGPATSARLSFPSSVAVDAAGNLYIADEDNYRVRKVANGAISTIAGDGTAGYSGDNGPATSAQLRPSISLAVDASGNVYIADPRSNVVRKVSSGAITTVAGNGTKGYSGDNGPAANARLDEPAGVAVDASGALYIADSGNHAVRKVADGVITTVAGNGTKGYSGDNGPATSAQLSGPGSVAVDSLGNLYIADCGNHRVRKVTKGAISTIAGTGTTAYSGDDGPATGARLFGIRGIAVDMSGNVYFADPTNNVVRVLVPESDPPKPLH